MTLLLVLTQRGADPSLPQEFQGTENEFNRNNDFAFAGEINSAFRCPFAAHVRKTNPRDDLEVPPPPIPPIPVEGRRIMRRGVQFGPEVTQEETKAAKTQHGRGLLFACYQTSIVNGFQFLQHSKYFLVIKQVDTERAPHRLGEQREVPSVRKQARDPRVRACWKSSGIQILTVY
jgi:hypothetical protein